MAPYGSRVSSKISTAHALLIGRSERRAAGAGDGRSLILIPAADQPQWDWLPFLPALLEPYARQAGGHSFSETL